MQSCASHSRSAADETEPPKEGRLCSRRLFSEPWQTLWAAAEPREAVGVAAGCRHGPAAVDCREDLPGIDNFTTYKPVAILQL